MSLDVYLDTRCEACRACSGAIVFERNITHNVGAMARESGVYDPVWRPDECGIRHASDLIGPLREGLARLRADPERFKALEPDNGWGTYAGLVEFLEEYLAACEADPTAAVSVSR